MADKPILFSAPMIQALLREADQPGTGKTQTRRVLKPQPDNTSDPTGQGQWGSINRFGYWRRAEEAMLITPGDRLWVKETYRLGDYLDCHAARDCSPSHVYFEADGSCNFHGHPIKAEHRQDAPGKRRPSIFMRRDFSRLTLIVTDVRIQRLQEISEEDARAEGVQIDESRPSDVHRYYVPIGNGEVASGWDACDCFGHLWEIINGPGSWTRNDWVAAYTFTVHRANINDLRKDAA